MEPMVSMNDYPNFGQGFGIGSAADVENLNKALNTGNYAQVDGVNAQVNGAALQVESLEGSLKALTYTDQHIKFWKKITKTPAYSTVEEYNQVLSYGAPNGGFIREGQLPQTQDSEYKRQASLVKFIGTTREVTHPMTLVRTAHGDVIAQQNREGILWMLKQLEHGLFWGNSALAAEGKEGPQFDGLESMIPDDNTIDLQGNDLREIELNKAAEMIMENYGFPTDLFVPMEVMHNFSQEYFPKERVIMPTGSGYQAGVVVNKFQTVGGSVDFEPDLFLNKTKPLSPAGFGGTSAPTAVKSAAVELGTETDAEFAKSGAGTYSYSVTACNECGESIPVDAGTDIALTEADLSKGVKITITNSAALVVAPEWFNVYRTEKDGKQKYLIARVPAASTVAEGTTTFVDKNATMPNTYTAFMGQLTPDVITFKQLAPLMKMDLAQLAPVYRWMLLLYGVPILYMPRKWVRLKNIKSHLNNVKPVDLYR